MWHPPRDKCSLHAQAERRSQANQSNATRFRTLHAHLKWPSIYTMGWLWAVTYTTYIRNRVISRTIKITPFESWNDIVDTDDHAMDVDKDQPPVDQTPEDNEHKTNETETSPAGANLNENTIPLDDSNHDVDDENLHRKSTRVNEVLSDDQFTKGTLIVPPNKRADQLVHQNTARDHPMATVSSKRSKPL
ncbi:hypothetical protein DAPPUDRAFT_256225 [Daphnia pulex]|uniref:Uncharacterized protein n=1 Tax=Daphnia pulex TaxID=6669 RepID=E9HB71_DAPPU|nr:hypothetical protein DAPPUDRAFT_256225 [Daphnia pulex]|eukprot:EFX71000.1 hypothetical protein DAPPUDRAFT_256225 [Daphnia pulex]